MKRTKLIAAISSCVIALGFSGAPTALAGIGGDQGGNPGNPQGHGRYQKSGCTWKGPQPSQPQSETRSNTSVSAQTLQQPQGEITGILPKCADSDVEAIYVLMQGRGRFTPNRFPAQCHGW